MSASSLLAGCFIATLAWLAPADEPSSKDEPRPAAQIVREFDRIALPSYSGPTEEDREKFKAAIRAGCRRQAELALELYKGHPEHAAVPRLMHIRWASMSNALGLADAVDAETTGFLGVEMRADLRRQAYQARARARLVSDKFDVVKKRAAIDDAIREDPTNEMGGVHLMELVTEHVLPQSDLAPICDLILDKWPRSRWAGVRAKSLKRHLDRVGEIIPHEGRDARTGKDVPNENAARPTLLMIFDGHVEYVLDELEMIRELRSTHGKKLDVVGVLLMEWREEEPLTDYLARRKIDWPVVHFPDESPWEGRWRMPRSPFYYLLDARGRLSAVGYRPDQLRRSVEALVD